jgi:hypothetical protein
VATETPQNSSPAENAHRGRCLSRRDQVIGRDVENIAAFESEVEANEWIANDSHEWLERRKRG